MIKSILADKKPSIYLSLKWGTDMWRSGNSPGHSALAGSGFALARTPQAVSVKVITVFEHRNLLNKYYMEEVMPEVLQGARRDHARVLQLHQFSWRTDYPEERRQRAATSGILGGRRNPNTAYPPVRG
jgi:hypothetical protein